MDYRYSYSGADATAFAWYEGVEEQIVRLESLHTVSMSVHEAKGQVRTLGYRGIRGLTRSVRTIAGSMIFIVIDDHPLRQMMNLAPQSPMFTNLGWSEDRDVVGTGTALSNLDFTNRLGTLLPPMNMLITYVHESPSLSKANSPEMINQIAAGTTTADLNIQGSALMLKGLEFLDEGLVTSVNDIVSEITYSFIARDYKELSMMDKTFVASQSKWTPAQNEDQNRKQAAMRRAMGMGSNRSMDNMAAPRPTTIVDENGNTVSPNALTGWEQRALRESGAQLGGNENWFKDTTWI